QLFNKIKIPTISIHDIEDYSFQESPHIYKCKERNKFSISNSNSHKISPNSGCILYGEKYASI
ncbi:MAG: hypothetical protein VW905_06925, partial [Gammaproteobacteria bacterium]